MARQCKNWLDEYLLFTENTEAPDKFHFWAGVSTIAGALRRKVKLNMVHFEWYPNFYIFFVAPPGIVNKSTTGSIGMDLLKEIDGIKFGPSAGTWQALIEQMAEMAEAFELENEWHTMTPVTIIISELGTFLDPQDQMQINVLTDLWDGKTQVWEKITKKDGSEQVINPWLNMLGFTTPSWIAENLTDYFSGGGFMSRSIFVYAEKKKAYIAYPQVTMSEDHFKRKRKLIDDLLAISYMKGEFTLTDEAIAWGTQWYQDHNTMEHAHIAGEMFAGYLARKQTHMHKLAMILSVADSDKMVITKDHLKLSHDKLTSLEHDMPKIFGMMGKEDIMRQAADVVRFLRNRKGAQASRTQLYREFSNIVSFDTFEKIMRSLKASGLVKELSDPNGVLMYTAVKQASKEQKDG